MWRDVVQEWVSGWFFTPAEGAMAALDARMADMPAEARIAFARELLAGTGRVVARDVGVVQAPDTPLLPSAPTIRHAFRAGWASGFNDCRAEMMGDEE